MSDLKHLEEKIIDSFKEDFDGENSYLIIKFKGGGKINIVSFLNGDKGTAQMDIDTAKLSSQEIIGKKIKKFTETFDGESDHLKIHLEGGHVIEITPFSSNPESTASLDINVYSSDKIVAESLSENMYQKRGEYTMSKPQYENDVDYNPYDDFMDRVIVVTAFPGKDDILFDLHDILQNLYQSVYIDQEISEDGNPVLAIEDDNATIESVSDELAEYIQDGYINTVDEIEVPH